MGRILGIDYGRKRCGLAVTDPLHIVVTPLDTVATDDLLSFIEQYVEEEDMDKIVIGLPTHKDGRPTDVYTDIKKLESNIVEKLSIQVEFEDESFTSAEAKDIIFQMGIKKKKRRDKSLVDKVSAVLILQRYLGHV